MVHAVVNSIVTAAGFFVFVTFGALERVCTVLSLLAAVGTLYLVALFTGSFKFIRRNAHNRLPPYGLSKKLDIPTISLAPG